MPKKSYNNKLMVELMTPRSPETSERIHGFYNEIGWAHRNDSRSEFETIVLPLNVAGPVPKIAYWQTENPAKLRKFKDYKTGRPTDFSKGLRHPTLQDQFELCLVLPNDDDVERVFYTGGEVLEAHTYVPLREHCDALEFRFADPFNYALRVTTDAGWEI